MQTEGRRFLSVNYDGVIKSGQFKNDNTLTLYYIVTAGDTWNQIQGQCSGISQKATAKEDKIVWNMPFRLKFEAKEITQSPQLTIVLYATDYFGRSYVRGYGNVHLPRTDGIHKRKIRTFTPIQPKTFWSCLNCCTSSFQQFKEAEKVLTRGQDREHSKVQYLGEVTLEVEVVRDNFYEQGYE